MMRTPETILGALPRAIPPAAKMATVHRLVTDRAQLPARPMVGQPAAQVLPFYAARRREKYKVASHRELDSFEEY